MSRRDPVLLRILDANLNRAREALRVMEEYARLALDDASLSAAIKEVRHALATAAARVERSLTTGSWNAARPAEQRGVPPTPLNPPLVRGEVDHHGSGLAVDHRGSGVEADCGESDPESARGEACGSDFESAWAEARGSGAYEASLIRSRDIVGDVGREIGTSAEYQREGVWSVAVAAGKRLSEALRVVEEYGKAIDPTFAAAVERIRYRGYELERRLHVTVGARGRLGCLPLYVIITEALCHADWWVTAEAALRGGAGCLQLREKDLSDRELLQRARRLCKRCHDHDALFIVNDRPDVAVLSGADGVHLGQDDLDVAAARRIIPPACVIGVSTHSVEQIRVAAAEAPDYIAVGPMFASSTKPQDHIPGPSLAAEARQLTSLPVVPIGGIDADNAHHVLATGATCLCVCTAVIAQPDVAAAAARLRAMVDSARTAP